MSIDGRGHGVDIADAGYVPRSDPESSHLAVLTGEISIGAQMLGLLIAGGIVLAGACAATSRARGEALQEMTVPGVGRQSWIVPSATIVPIPVQRS